MKLSLSPSCISKIWQGPIFLEFDSKLKFGDQLILLKINLSNLGIHKSISIILSRFWRILASQNRIRSLCNELFNIDRFLD